MTLVFLLSPGTQIFPKFRSLTPNCAFCPFLNPPGSSVTAQNRFKDTLRSSRSESLKKWEAQAQPKLIPSFHDNDVEASAAMAESALLSLPVVHVDEYGKNPLQL